MTVRRNCPTVLTKYEPSIIYFVKIFEGFLILAGGKSPLEVAYHTGLFLEKYSMLWDRKFRSGKIDV